MTPSIASEKLSRNLSKDLPVLAAGRLRANKETWFVLVVAPPRSTEKNTETGEVLS